MALMANIVGISDAAMGTVKMCRLERPEWRVRAAIFSDNNYRQLWDYGVDLAQLRGACSEHVAINVDDDVVGMADVRIKRMPLAGGLAYISGGPLTRRGFADDADRLRVSVAALRDEYAVKRRLVLRIAPPLADPDWMAMAAGVFQECGFHGTTMGRPYRTIVLDIGGPLETVRRNLAQKWRNCLNGAERAGHEVVVAEDQTALERFRGLFNEFIQRKGFGVELGAEFYSRVQAKLDAADRMVVSLALREGRLVAGHVSSILGDTCVYLLGATNEEGLKSKAAYLLQWHAIKEAHERGLRWYDLGGIDPVDNPGVYHFKNGLGGTDVTVPGPFEFTCGLLSQRFVHCAEWAVKGLRRLRSGRRA